MVPVSRSLFIRRILGLVMASALIACCHARQGSPPAPPVGLTAIGKAAMVNLSWAGSVGATSYELFRSEDGGVNYSQIHSSPGTSWTDMGVGYNTTYYYEVTASNAYGVSAPSQPVRVSTTGTTANLTATRLGTWISLSWPSHGPLTVYSASSPSGPWTSVKVFALAGQYTGWAD